MQPIDLTVAQAAAAIATGQLGAEEYARALLAQAERFASMNAFIHLDPEAVLASAKAADARRARGETLGPLHGVPLAIKDNLDTAGVPTTAGTPGLRGNVPSKDAPVVDRLTKAGAIVLGKTNMHELAFGITSNNAAFGPARNPWDPSRIAGGSSGGTGVAVGARMAPGGVGSDTGGSVRVPAALCGIAGLRPTLGLWPQDGIVPISHTRDTAGPMARTVEDCMLLHDVVTGSRTREAPVPPLTGVRLGVPRADFWADLEAETARLCEAALHTLRDAGAVLIEADLIDVMTLEGKAGFPIALYETVTDLNAYLKAHGSTHDFASLVQLCASPDVAGLLQHVAGAGAIPEALYREAMDIHRPALQAAYVRYFHQHRVDAVVFPTTSLPAAPVGQDETVLVNGKPVSTFHAFIRNTSPGSVAGLPGLSVPVGLTSTRLPVGLELDGLVGSDARLLSLGRALEALLPPLPSAC